MCRTTFDDVGDMRHRMPTSEASDAVDGEIYRSNSIRCAHGWLAVCGKQNAEQNAIRCGLHTLNCGEVWQQQQLGIHELLQALVASTAQVSPVWLSGCSCQLGRLSPRHFAPHVVQTISGCVRRRVTPLEDTLCSIVTIGHVCITYKRIC